MIPSGSMLSKVGNMRRGEAGLLLTLDTKAE